MRKTIVLGLCLVVLLTGVTLVAVGCGSESSSSQDSGTAGVNADLTYVVQTCRANQRNLQAACNIYFVDKMQWPRSLNDLVPTYLQAKDLQCPAGSGYTLRVSGDSVTIICPNGHTL